jgi:hypothetical protein
VPATAFLAPPAICGWSGIAPIGLAGEQEGSRRPQSSRSRTAPPIEQRIVQLRRQRPDWGARKLAVLLAGEGLTVPRMKPSNRLQSRKLRIQRRYRGATVAEDGQLGWLQGDGQVDAGGMERGRELAAGFPDVRP